MMTYFWFPEYDSGVLTVGKCTSRQDAIDYLRKEHTDGTWVPGDHHFTADRLIVVDQMNVDWRNDVRAYLRMNYRVSN